MHRLGLPPHRRLNPAAAPLEHELAQEMATALGRSGRRLETALQALCAFDAAGSCHAVAGADAAVRDDLVATAADAYWCFIVQREACGLFCVEAVDDRYKVPVDVRRQAGIAATLRPTARTRWLR